MPGNSERDLNCFSCASKGDILSALQYKESVIGFHNGVKFLSVKYNIKIETEIYLPILHT